MSNIIPFPLKEGQQQQSVDEWFAEFETNMLEDKDETTSKVIKVGMTQTRQRLENVIPKLRKGIAVKCDKLPENEKELLKVVQDSSDSTNRIITDLILAVLLAEMDIILVSHGETPLNRGPQ